MTMSMPEITRCDATECSYNRDRQCHTMAITIGDASCPMCDTFVQTDASGGDPSVIGRVGACKTSNCRYNEALECTAESINVGMHSRHADCMTFSSR
ncbi:MAG: hypothetical protein BWZ01_00413 [Deltaproteobacteria bacterium ADurb.BinA179]|jgi:hypothetical protein|nr:DUF1540 domain-containing protein [Deltaproteobacteria bacterium]MDI9541841.1 DUF1540 domain-containing protein [Pseudomonadota bacterium]NLW69199.1 DUF1540 domain-containing protein [Bacteriovoracaceae bacterium]OPZ29765.1 MAG: hypothetical protein BWZ01_00413 [Deltaproteobacteria bacterium ADurb.BinA179]HRR20904.1 DUF1540 domain-containing protein [Desulfomonilia bacterium]